MSRKDFELIAYVLRRYSEDRQPLPAGLLEAFADALAGTNPRFNRERFRRAATAADKVHASVLGEVA
jgi:hypothetical protein